MPAYTYTGDEGRYYPTLALTPAPGGEYDLDHNPGDGRWTPDDPAPEPAAEAEAPTPAEPGQHMLTRDEIRALDGLPPAAPAADEAPADGPPAAPAPRAARTRAKKEV